MIKTEKKVIALFVMMVFGAALVFAQQSNSDIATFGRFQNDADWFFSSYDWKNVEMKGLFGYSRFGANIPAGVIDAGASFKAGNIYIGAYYNGKALGLKDDTSITTDVILSDPDPDRKGTETISVSEKRKTNVNAFYGLLAGFGTTGIKFTFEDDLAVTGVPASTAEYTERTIGKLVPTLEVGGHFGPIYKISLGVPIVYDTDTTTTTTGSTVEYTTTTIGTGGTYANNLDKLLNADGSYVQIDIGLSMEFGKLNLDNNLRFNLYGVNAGQIDGKTESQAGVADTYAFYDPFTGAGNISRYITVYDNRSWIQDEIVPSFDIAKGESGKLAYAVNFGVPIKFTFVNHALNAEGTQNSQFTPELGSSFSIKDYWQQDNFDLGIDPYLKAGVQWKPLEIISLQAGIGLDIFSWTLKSVTMTEVKDYEPTSSEGRASDWLASNGFGNYIATSPEGSAVTYDFTYPNLSFALGFTVYIKKIALLDFVYINKYNPSLAGLFYKAVGEGLGSGDTSIVLTIKF